MKFSEASERDLACGHRIMFGNCGAAGEGNQITHQKDAQLLVTYDDFFKTTGALGFAPKRILEIGVCRGGSLAIWREIFPAAEIVGVDIDLGQIQPQTLAHYREDARIQIHQIEMPSESIRSLGQFDLIIDDGGHGPKAVFPTFELCWPMLNDDGIYIVEDWHQDFLEPKVQLSHFIQKMIGYWPSPMPTKGDPFKITAYRAFYAMEKVR